MNYTQSFWMKTGTMIFVLCACLLQVGCADLQGAIAQTNAWRENAQGIETELQAQLDQLEHQRTTVLDSSPSASLFDTAIAQANMKIHALNTAISQADLVLTEAQNPTDSITQIANTISPWVPAPAQGPIVLGAALVAILFRSRNLKNSAASIIQSIEHAMSRDPEFKQIFNRHADTIRTIQTPGARKLIDTTVRKARKPAVMN